MRPFVTSVGRSLLGLVTVAALACPAAAAERLPLRTYTTADGLAHDSVLRIVRDSRGFLWFCTADGLSRFDGDTFVSFGVAEGLPHQRINDLLETRNGEYWVATQAGIVRFDPRGRPQKAGEGGNGNAMFTTVAAPEGGWRANAATVLREAEDGTIWVGTHDGLFRLQRGAKAELERVVVDIPQVPPESRAVTDILEAQGSLWISSASGLVRRRPDATAVRFTVADGMPGHDIVDLLQDREGRLWAATRQKGFFEFRVRSAPGSPLLVGERHGAAELPSPSIFQLHETSDGRFWAGTALGLAEFVQPKEAGPATFRTYSVRNGLSDHVIVGLTEDSGGNLWLATNRAGVMRLARNGVTSYGEPEGIAQVTSIFDGGGDTLCLCSSLSPGGPGEGEQLRRYGCLHGDTFRWFAPSAIRDEGGGGERIVLRTRVGEWWIGTGAGVYRFAANSDFTALETAPAAHVYTPNDGLASPQVFRLFEDSGGNVWISTTGELRHGLARWEVATGRVRDLAHTEGLPPLEGELPRAFAEDHQRQVWIGFNGGLARYANGQFTYYTTRDGLPEGAVMDIHVDAAGRVWLASSASGLVRVDGGATAQPNFVPHTTAQGLSSHNTEAIAEDLRGLIYVGGSRGLDRFDPATGRVKHFTIADGLPTGSFRSAFRDGHGVLWFGMSSGIARLVPMVDKSPIAPSVLIRGVRVAGMPRAVSAIGELEVSLRDVASGQNSVEIDFGGSNFTVGEPLRYQYRLEGANEPWSEPTERRSVTYASLRPGSYRLVVRAVDAQGGASTQPAGVSFTILQPFWRRWWFLSLVGLAAVGLARTAYRHRVARLVETARLRPRPVTDLDDDPVANLRRIALLTEVAKGPAVPEVSGQLVSTGEIVETSDPGWETVDELANRLRAYASEVFAPRNIDVRFHAAGLREGLRLGADVRRDLRRVFKEAVLNAARHSNCTRVDIRLTLEGSQLSLIVCDNGRGFETSLPPTGEGLASMARRTRRLGGALEIASAPGSGTVVKIDLIV